MDFFYVKDDEEIPVGNGNSIPDDVEIQCRSSGVPQEVLDLLASETICDIEEDIFNPNQDIKDWDE